MAKTENRKVMRKLVSSVDSIICVLSGVLLGYYLNRRLSLESFSASATNRIITFVFIPSLIVALLIISFKKIGKTSPYIKARTVLLGASFISLFFAFSNFLKFYLPYLGGEPFTIERDTFTNIFKALLLTSLFSAIERSIKFWEDWRKA